MEGRKEGEEEEKGVRREGEWREEKKEGGKREGGKRDGGRMEEETERKEEKVE